MSRCVACGGSHLSSGCSNPREQPQCCGCGGKQTANYRGSVKWKEARAALAKQGPERSRKNAVTGHRAAPKTQQAGPSVEQTNLGEGWNHVVRRGRVVKATTPPPNSIPNSTLQPVMEVPRQPKVIATRKTAGPKKPEPKSTAANKPSAYLFTPWSRVLLEKLTGSAASQEIPCIFGTRRFITVLTSARHPSLS